MMAAIRILVALALVLAQFELALAGTGTITSKDAAGVTRTFVVTTDGSGNFVPQSVICDATAAATCAAVGANGLAVSATLTGTVPLPTGAATSALQTTGNTALSTINTTLGSPFQVGGSIGNTAFGISGTLPAFAATPTVNLGTLNGAATATNQTSVIGTKAAGTAATNSLLTGCVYNASGVAPADTNQVSLQCDSAGNVKVSGIGVAQASPTSGQTLSLIGGAAATSPPTTTAGNTYPLSMTTAGGLRTDLSSLAGTATDTNSGNKSAGTLRNVLATDQLALATWGHGPTGSAVPAGATLDGCRMQNAEATAGSNGNMAAAACDLVGKKIVLPYANPENIVSGFTAAMTGTTSTSLLVAPAAGLRNYVTDLYCVNSHATVSTFVNIQDGSGGTTIYQGYAGAVGGGFGRSFNVALKQPTLATALFVANVTTGANVVCNAVGYKGA